MSLVSIYRRLDSDEIDGDALAQWFRDQLSARTDGGHFEHYDRAFPGFPICPACSDYGTEVLVEYPCPIAAARERDGVS